MRNRREHRFEQENHERWLVSYADFITLLFAFFVVMYAVSSVNEGKYRVLSQVMETAFRARSATAEPVQAGAVARSWLPQGSSGPHRAVSLIPELRPFPGYTVYPVAPRPPEQPVDTLDRSGIPPAVEENSLTGSERLAGASDEPPVNSEDEPQPVNEEPPDSLEPVLSRLQDSLSELMQGDLVQIRNNGQSIEVEIRNNILFPSGSAAISEQAVAPLVRIAGILRDTPNRIRVEGFTDNIPINTPAYPSNWELSAARAASVVHLLMKSGIRPERMTAVGHGEYRPVGNNTTEQGRIRNRRVLLVILNDEAEPHRPMNPDPGSIRPGTVTTGSNPA